MATLILNAGTSSPINLVVQTADENQPTEIGSVTPNFNGADRSSVRGVKRNYGSLTTYLDTTSKDAVINLLKNGIQLPCSGDLLANIQTQCTVRYTGARMAQGTATGLWKVGLTLSEVQPNVTLLRYAPGDTITGESFSRATGGLYYDANGVVTTVGVNVKRDGHYLGGKRSLLLEGATTNLLLQSEVLGTTWTTSNSTVGTNATTAPDGNVTADKIQEDNINNVHPIIQSVTGLTDNATYNYTHFLKPGERTWAALNIQGKDGGSRTAFFNLSGAGSIGTLSGGVVASIQAVANGFYRCSMSATVATGGSTPRVLTYPATGDLANSYLGTTGSGIYGWGAHLDPWGFPTSYFPTTTAQATRQVDSYSLPFTTPPGEMSVYIKFVELGTVKAVGWRLFEISAAGDTSPRFILQSQPTVYGTYHGSSLSAVTSVLGAGPALGDTVELVARLYGDGSTDVLQSINGAAQTASTQSAANAVATAWSGLLCWLNSGGTVAGSQGYIAIQSFKIVAGMRSLAEMRAA